MADLGGILYRVIPRPGRSRPRANWTLAPDSWRGRSWIPATGSCTCFLLTTAARACLDALSETVDCSGVYQLDTTFAAGALGSEAAVGSSDVTDTPNPLYLGAFDSSYYDSTGINAATGNLYVCGNTGGAPTLYQVAIAAGVMPASGGQSIAPLTPLSSTASCSPVTDIPNPNVLGAGIFSERLFASVQNNGSLSACASGGCILNLIDTPWQPFVTRTIGQQILSPRGHVVTATTNGTSAGTDLVPWPNQAAFTYTDGTEIWIDQGALTSPFVAYQSSHTYVTLKVKILDTNNNIQILTTKGTTGALPPTWKTGPGQTTADGTAVWTNVGAFPMFGLAASGGTSGIIVDNVLGPSVVGGSQVYFRTLSDQLCTTSGGTGGCAVQASQPALQ